MENAEHRCDAIRQEAKQKAADLRETRMQQAMAQRKKAEADAGAEAETQTREAQQETAALAQQLRAKARQNSEKAIRAILEEITG